MNQLSTFVTQHWGVIVTVTAFLGMPAISTMPKTWTAGFFQTVWGWFYDWSHEVVGALSQKYATQLQALQGVNPPSPTPTQVQEEKAGLVPPQATFPEQPK